MNPLSTSAIAAAALLAASTTIATVPAHAADMEKCYGVAKAGANDCKAGSHGCAGMSKVSGDPASFILVPAGTCEKLVGGKMKPS